MKEELAPQETEHAAQARREAEEEEWFEAEYAALQAREKEERELVEAEEQKLQVVIRQPPTFVSPSHSHHHQSVPYDHTWHIAIGHCVLSVFQDVVTQLVEAITSRSIDELKIAIRVAEKAALRSPPSELQEAKNLKVWIRKFPQSMILTLSLSLGFFCACRCSMLADTTRGGFLDDDERRGRIACIYRKLSPCD